MSISDKELKTLLHTEASIPADPLAWMSNQPSLSNGGGLAAPGRPNIDDERMASKPKLKVD